MLSILIPTYNTNVVDLTYEIHRQSELESFAFEIIILDDGSSERSIQKENKALLSLAYCQYIEQEKNLGRTATRSRLAELAQYDWLLFLDADVFPKYPDFLKRFDLQSQQHDIIFGGVAYKKERPASHELLRWKYGSAREAKPVHERLKAPHFIISQNLLLKKAIFKVINTEGENRYGLDNIVSYEIYRHQYTVCHLDNPVYHLGLENNTTFLGKSVESLRTTLHFAEKGNFPDNFRPVQRVYLKMKKYRLLAIYSSLVKPCLRKIEKNLHSSNPNLKLYDAYRLFHYIQLKQQQNA